MVLGIIEMAHAVGFSTVAKGVETHNQLEKLTTLGCDGAQGWQIAPPMPAEDCTQWLDRYRC